MPEYGFTAELFRWKGHSAWHFIALPESTADEIEQLAGGGPGFGSVRVSVTIGATRWQTSLFPDRARGTYLLPVKKQVRMAEHLDEGSSVMVTLWVEVS